MRSSKERVVKKRLADGTIREYRYAKAPKAAPASTTSFGALLQAYRRSPEFIALKPASKRVYGYMIRHLEALAPYNVRDIKRRNVLGLRDAIAQAHGAPSASTAIRVLSTIMTWGVDREWLESSPAQRIKRLKSGEYAAWTAEEADFAEDAFLESLRRVIILARYTGQRRADLASMTWSAYDGTCIRVKQQKTGAELLIPAHPRLKDELDAWRRTASSTHVLGSGLIL